MCSVVFRWTQPQRDMCWLHRLLHDCEQVLTQLAQVHFIAQRGAERLQRSWPHHTCDGRSDDQ